MYDQFYGFSGRPFQLTPDPHFYFESATHRKALSYLGYGLAQGEGFIVITGDIGAGKTTLVGHLMATIDPVRLTAVKIVSTQVEGDDMLRLAAQSFGVAIDAAPKAQLLQRIEAFLHGQARAGRRTLLIVDEAQNLPISALEELRMLSNFQLGGQSLLQIFLLGQPEFRDLLKSPELEQLRQRVIATHHLEPMMASEVEPYILHRLTVVGWTGNPRFTPEAFAAIYAATAGVPRRVNALASRVLLMGAIDQLDEIDADVVAAVAADMGVDSDARPAPVAHSALDEAEEPVGFAAEAEPKAEAVPEPAAAEAAPEHDAIDEPIASEAAPEPAAESAPTHEEPAYMAARHVGEEEWEFAVEQAVDEAPPVDTHAFAEPAAGAPSPEILEEIAALRAELAALRAAPEPVAEPLIDIDALAAHFNLIEQRLSGVEMRAKEQDAALRRVLTLLVDWVEREERMIDTPAAA